MTGDAILDPVVAMLVLTAAVWFLMYARRLPAMRRAGKPAQAYTTPDTISTLPERVNYPAYNFRNLLELPMLFYVACFYLYVTQTADALHVAAAWTFFGCRVLHSAIHCTVNIVMLRFLAYVGSALALWLMLARIVARSIGF